MKDNSRHPASWTEHDLSRSGKRSQGGSSFEFWCAGQWAPRTEQIWRKDPAFTELNPQSWTRQILFLGSGASSVKSGIGIKHWLKFGLVPWSISRATVEHESGVHTCKPQTWKVKQEDQYFKAFLGYILSPKTDQGIWEPVSKAKIECREEKYVPIPLMLF